MKRARPGLALVAACLIAVPAAASNEQHRHRGLLFEIRLDQDMSDPVIYRAFLTDTADPASLLVERGDGNLGDEGQADLTPATCPALGPILARLATLPLPAAALESPRPPRPNAGYVANVSTYHFAGFVHFPNGGEGQVTFYAYDEPGQRADPLLEWERGLVRAVDACRPRARRGG